MLLHVEGVHQSHQRSRYKQAKPNTPSKSRRRRRRKLRTKKKTPKTKRERPGLEVCSKLLVGRCRSALLLPIRGRAEAFFHFVRMSKNNHQHHQEPSWKAWTIGQEYGYSLTKRVSYGYFNLLVFSAFLYVVAMSSTNRNHPTKAWTLTFICL